MAMAMAMAMTMTMTMTMTMDGRNRDSARRGREAKRSTKLVDDIISVSERFSLGCGKVPR
jgi:hypothetical protein